MTAEKPQEEGAEQQQQRQQNKEVSHYSDKKPRPTRGYAHLAEFMAKTHHGMMRRFRDLSTLNLLYLQAELYQLKFELDRETAVDMDCHEDDERSLWDYHWRLLATSGIRTEGKRWKIWLRLRQTLYDYRELNTTNSSQNEAKCFLLDDGLGTCKVHLFLHHRRMNPG